MPDLEGLAGTVMAQVRSRIELLSVEWQEEKLRLRKLILLLLLVLFFVQLGVVLVVMGLVVAYWDTPSRLLIIGFAAVACLGCAWLCWHTLAGSTTAKPRLFDASIDQLRQDEQLLRRAPP
jgi:uncharacterized membrane protein YqjE